MIKLLFTHIGFTTRIVILLHLLCYPTIVFTQYETRVNSSDNTFQKYSPLVHPLLKNKSKHAMYKEWIILANSSARLMERLQKLKNVKIISVQPTINACIINCTQKVLDEIIAPWPEVVFIDIKQQPIEETALPGYTRAVHQWSRSLLEWPELQGTDIVIGVKERNISQDLDLNKRLLPSPIAHNEINDHANEIAILIAGAGNSSYASLGIASNGKIFPSGFSNLFADDDKILTEYKVSVQNHSYGTIIQPFYGAEALSYDRQAWALPHLVHVFSIGNEGNSAALEGSYKNIIGLANATGNFKMAKNPIIVGATDKNGTVSVLSSSGPTYDGRLLPHITAYGPNGTSDAAAYVSGTIALLQQAFLDKKKTIPPASLIKAILYNAADDIHTPGIDYKSGYGGLNMYKSIQSIMSSSYHIDSIKTNQTKEYTINVPANVQILKITLAWTDTAASINASTALTNDLNLELIQISNQKKYLPWVLSSVPHRDSLSALPTRNIDSLNTSEQITIDKPEAGEYILRIYSNKIKTQATQSFAFVYHIDTFDNFNFISPLISEDLLPKSNEIPIKWKSTCKDKNETGSLYWSTNRGLTWKLIDSAVLLQKNEYTLTNIPVPGFLSFKMDTRFGSFISPVVLNQSILQIKYDYNCTDSSKISWPRYPLANEYKLFELVDSSHMNFYKTIKDTAYTFNKNDVANWYALLPVLEDSSVRAIRSTMEQIRHSAIKCFAKAFYADIEQDNRIKLILELTTSEYVKEIEFERVTPMGGLLKNIEKIAAIPSQLIYSITTFNLQTGEEYYRAKIILQNGGVIYSELLPVRTSGEKNILFYPNPLKSGTPINYLIKQGIPGEKRILFYDLYGKLIAEDTFFSGSYIVPSTLRSILIYKLVSVDGQLLDAGKLIIN